MHGRFESLLDGVTVREVREGESYGEIVAFTQKEYPGLVVRVAEPSVVLRLDAQVFRDLLYQYSEIAVALMQRFSSVIDLLIAPRTESEESSS